MPGPQPPWAHLQINMATRHVRYGDPRQVRQEFKSRHALKKRHGWKAPLRTFRRLLRDLSCRQLPQPQLPRRTSARSAASAGDGPSATKASSGMPRKDGW